MCPRRTLQPGNPDLCGEVPLNLRGIVATIVGETANVKEIDTLGVCNGRARPGTVPEPAPGLAPSGTPKPATNEQPQPGPRASPGSHAPQPGARPGQGSHNVNAAGADPAQAAPGPEPAVATMPVGSPSPSGAQKPNTAAAGPPTSRSSAPTTPQRTPSPMVRPAASCHVLQYCISFDGVRADSLCDA